MTKYNDVPFVPCNDCSNWESCQEEAYEQGRADAIEEYFNKMQSVAFGNRKGLIHFKDILSIREQLKELGNE